MEANLKEKPWYDYLEEDLRELLAESFQLIDAVPSWKDQFHDYSFVVFPAAKAYEGYLKKLFLDMGFITEQDYYGKHFRIGKALNSQLENEFRQKESVYDKLVKYSGNDLLAEKLWNTWKNCRNLVFHWFPDEKRAITFDDAKNRIGLVVDAIDDSYAKLKHAEGKSS